MKHLDAEQLKLMGRLLGRAEEFLDFFDRAETKMIKWRHDIIEQAAFQQEQLNELKTELNRIENIISAASLENFRIASEETNDHGDYLFSLKNTEEQLLRQIHGHRAELTRITQHAMTRITQKTSQAMTILDEKLSQHQSVCSHHIIPQHVSTIDETYNETTHKDKPPYKYTEWRSVTLTLATSLITALVFGLYTNNEYPWEMHQQALTERDAGKMLINAWPSLTHHEKHKILYRTS